MKIFDLVLLQQSTMENLTIYLWQTMKLEMHSPELLYQVRLTDDEKNSVVYNGLGGYSQSRGQSLITSDTDWAKITSFSEFDNQEKSKCKNIQQKIAQHFNASDEYWHRARDSSATIRPIWKMTDNITIIMQTSFAQFIYSFREIYCYIQWYITIVHFKKCSK